MVFTFGKDLSARALVLLHHLNGEDVVDLDVMGRDAVVQEVGGEHHVVARVPELWVVLSVEPQDVAVADEAEPVEHHHRAEEVHEQGREVQRPVLHSQESRGDRAHHAHLLVDRHPEEVHHLEGLEEGVARHLALAHLEGASHAADHAGTLGESLVNEVLEAARVTEEPGLESS